MQILESTNPGLGNLMTNEAEINSEDQLCHGPEGGAGNQPLVGDGQGQVRLILEKRFSISHFSFLICHRRSLVINRFHRSV